MFSFFRHKEAPVAPKTRKKTAAPATPAVNQKLSEISTVSHANSTILNSIQQAINHLSNKQDIERVLNEIAVSKESILAAVNELPDNDDIVQMLVSQITEPLKTFLNTRLQAETITVPPSTEARPARPRFELPYGEGELDTIVTEMKSKLSLLSQRHIRIINVLAQNRNLWVDYDAIGDRCNPQLTGSCIRGYISDLIKNYKLPIEKKNFGRQMKIRLSDTAFKKMVMAKLVEQ